MFERFKWNSFNINITILQTICLARLDCFNVLRGLTPVLIHQNSSAVLFYPFIKSLRNCTVLSVLSMHSQICPVVFIHDFPVKLLFTVKMYILNCIYSFYRPTYGKKRQCFRNQLYDC